MDSINKHIQKLNIDKAKRIGESDTQLENVLLVQPNKVTNARYEFDEREEDILTIMIHALQKHMNRQEEIRRDLFNQPMVSIVAKDKYEKRRFIYSLNKMVRKVVSFEWQDSNDKRKKKTTAPLIAAFHDTLGTLNIDVTINSWSLPYLLYWGKGVGGTIFNKRIALTLVGKYSKRMYKLCKRWEDKGGFVMTLDEFKVMLKLPKSYSKNKIEKRVLENSREEMMRDADVYFNYSITKENGSRSYNSINFKIFPNPKNKSVENQQLTSSYVGGKGDTYTFVYRIISIAYQPSKNSRAFDITEKLSEDPEQLKKIYKRFKRLEQENQSKNRNWSEAAPLIKYILDNDYGFNYSKKK